MSFSFRDVMGAFLVLAFVGATIMLSWRAVPAENEQLLAYMLGQLSGFVAGVVGYHYLTKSGEKELDQTRAENTGKALDLAAVSTIPNPLNSLDRPAGTPDDPVHTQEETKP